MILILKSASGQEWDYIPLINSIIKIPGAEIHAYRFSEADSLIKNDFVIPDYNDLNDFEELEIIFKHLSKANSIPEGISISDFDFLSGEDLQLFIDFRMSFPGFKIYFRIDVSDTSYIQAIMALKLGFDGLICSKNLFANPEFVGRIQNFLSSSKELNPKETDEMASIRNHINDIDKQIIRLLATRMEKVNSLAAIKSGSQITVIQPERWNEILKEAIEAGCKEGLSETFIREIFNAIHIGSIKKHLDKIS